MYNDDFFIDNKAMAIRKTEASKRAKAIGFFVNNNAKCRSKIISEYFGEKPKEDCGICDNCINNTEAKLPAQEFKKVSENIIALLKTENLSYKEILKRLKPLRQRSVWQVISFLIAEEEIFIGSDNLISLKN